MVVEVGASRGSYSAAEVLKFLYGLEITYIGDKEKKGVGMRMG